MQEIKIKALQISINIDASFGLYLSNDKNQKLFSNNKKLCKKLVLDALKRFIFRIDRNFKYGLI